MKLRLPYGKEGYLEAAIDEARIAGIIEPNRVPIGDEEEVIRRALEHPFGSPRLGEFLAGARDVLVIVNDQTRPTPTARVLDYLEPELAGLELGPAADQPDLLTVRLKLAPGVVAKVHDSSTLERVRLILYHPAGRQ